MSVADKLVGVWKLVNAHVSAVESGEVELAYGKNPSGFIHYTKKGRVLVLITHGGRKKVDGDRQDCPDDQKIEAFTTSISYAGNYSVEGDLVRHEIDVSTYENWVGTDLHRIAELDGDKFVLKTVPQMQNGVLSVLDIEWERFE